MSRSERASAVTERARTVRRLTLAAALSCMASSHVIAAPPIEGIGRAATPEEIKAWDIDVRPDFKGLPKGKGSVADGEKLWEERCTSCHGTFGDSNQVFTPIAGGTTEDDIKSGNAAVLKAGGVRSTLAKVPTVSTLWDYIYRAMPWMAPKSLSVDETYAAVAYVLSLGDIVDANFVLSDENIAKIDERLPNRNGMTRDHAMWPGKGKPDVPSDRCMKDCTVADSKPDGAKETAAGKSAAESGRVAKDPVLSRVRSEIPEHARDDWGNLAEQMRLVGATVGANTKLPPPQDYDRLRSSARSTLKDELQRALKD